MRVFNNHRQAYLKGKELGYNWVAMDKDGEWWGYMEKPMIEPHADMWFTSNTDQCGKLGVGYDSEEEWRTSDLKIIRVFEGLGDSFKVVRHGR